MTDAADLQPIVTDLILEVFRLNGRLLAAGDLLVGDLGLTSARWQVMGAIALAERPSPVAALARTMGLARQGVQRIVNELAAEGIVALGDNPLHKRARVVTLTPAGQALLDAATARQAPWARRLADAADYARLRAAVETLRTLRRRLEDQAPQLH